MPKKPKSQKKPKKPKKKLTPEQKTEKRRRKAEFETIFVGGKQKRVRRRPLIEGLDPDEFIRRNADPIWLHQNELWELMEPVPEAFQSPSQLELPILKEPSNKVAECDAPF